MKYEKARRVLPAVAVAAGLAACDQVESRGAKSVNDRADHVSKCLRDMTDVGNGVYFMPYCTPYNFKFAISRFLQEHPDLEISSISSTDAYSDSHIITTRPKACK